MTIFGESCLLATHLLEIFDFYFKSFDKIIILSKLPLHHSLFQINKVTHVTLSSHTEPSDTCLGFMLCNLVTYRVPYLVVCIPAVMAPADNVTGACCGVCHTWVIIGEVSDNPSGCPTERCDLKLIPTVSCYHTDTCDPVGPCRKPHDKCQIQ